MENRENHKNRITASLLERSVMPGQVTSLDQVIVGRRYLAVADLTGNRTEMTAVTGAYCDINTRSIKADFLMIDGREETRHMTDAGVVPYLTGGWNSFNRLIIV